MGMVLSMQSVINLELKIFVDAWLICYEEMYNYKLKWKHLVEPWEFM